MINLKRYSCAVYCQYGSADEDDEGDFVRFEDVRELLTRIQELERVLQLCSGYMDLSDVHQRYAFEQVKGLLK